MKISESRETNLTNHFQNERTQSTESIVYDFCRQMAMCKAAKQETIFSERSYFNDRLLLVYTVHCFYWIFVGNTFSIVAKF
jgi:hypothetical protein